MNRVIAGLSDGIYYEDDAELEAKARELEVQCRPDAKTMIPAEVLEAYRGGVLMHEAIASCQLEGWMFNRARAIDNLRSGVVESDIESALRNVVACHQEFSSYWDEPITMADLLSLHRRLGNGACDSWRGRLRRPGEIPAPSGPAGTDVPRLGDDATLEARFNQVLSAANARAAVPIEDRASAEPAFASASLPSYWISVAQPFLCYNGLIARMVFHRVALRAGMGGLELAPLSSYLLRAPDRYRSSLRGSDPLDMTDYLRVLTSAARKALREARAELEESTKSYVGEYHAIAIARDGTFVRGAGQPRVDLAKRKALPDILNRLIEEHRLHPGNSVSRDALIEAGWPDERILADAARNRLKVAVTALRKAGLADVLRFEAGGYLLEPKGNFVVVTD